MQVAAKNLRSRYDQPPARINMLFTRLPKHRNARQFFLKFPHLRPAWLPDPTTTKYEHPRVRIFNFINNELGLPDPDDKANLESAAPMTTTTTTTTANSTEDPSIVADPELDDFRRFVRDRLYKTILYKIKIEGRPPVADMESRNSLKIGIADLEKTLFAEAGTKEDYMNLKTLRRRLYHACYYPLPHFSYEDLCEGVTIDRNGHLIDHEGARIDPDPEDDTDEEEVRVKVLKFIEDELDLAANLEAPISTTTNTDPYWFTRVDPELQAFRDLVRDRLNVILQYRMKIEGRRKLAANVVDLERLMFAEANTKEDYMNLKTLRSRLYDKCRPPMRKRHASSEDTPPLLCKKARVEETSL